MVSKIQNGTRSEVFAGRSLVASRKSAAQGIAALPSTAHQGLEAVPLGDVPPHGVALVPVHPAFALLHVDGVGGEVPVDHRVAIAVKVEALLAHRGGGEDEGAERAVERVADDLGVRRVARVVSAA